LSPPAVKCQILAEISGFCPEVYVFACHSSDFDLSQYRSRHTIPMIS